MLEPSTRARESAKAIAVRGVARCQEAIQRLRTGHITTPNHSPDPALVRIRVSGKDHLRREPTIIAQVNVNYAM